MPSHESPTSTLADANDALFVALVDVCEKSFFTCVESREADRFGVLIDSAASLEWLKASVAFATRFRSPGHFRRSARPGGGQHVDGMLSRGALEVFVPERLARWLVASLLGIARDTEQAELRNEQVFDGIGEFANMLCGSWLTDLTANVAFALSPPEVTRLPADWKPPLKISHGLCGHHLCVNDLPMQVLVRTSTD